MPDKTIGQLPSVKEVSALSLIPAEQDGVASKISGEQLINFVKKPVENLDVSADTLEPGKPAYAKKTVSGDKIDIIFGIPKGEHGDGIGQIGFDVNDEGHLILSYSGENAPNFYIEDGHLMLNLEGVPTIDLGIVKGSDGKQGEPGIGVPPGGKTGQVLMKSSDNDYDTYWADANVQPEPIQPSYGVPDTWQSAPLPSGYKWSKLAYGNGVYVAISNTRNAPAAYSSGGVSWELTGPLPGDTTYSYICYGNDKFVITGSNLESAAYSSDGVNWVKIDTKSFYLGSLQCCNNKFFAISKEYSFCYYSDDGISWEQINIGCVNCKIAYGNGRYVAVGGNDSYSSATSGFSYSDDGKTWTTGNLPRSGFWYSLIYSNNKFVSIAYNSKLCVYSEDGLSWSYVDLPQSGYWNFLGYENKVFVSTLQSKFTAVDKSLYSLDGETWSESTIPVKAKWYYMASGGETFVITAYASDEVAYSKDGETWLSAKLPKVVTLESFIYGDRKFLGIADGDEVFYSEI